MRCPLSRRLKRSIGIAAVLLLITVLFTGVVVAAEGTTVTVAYIDYNNFVVRGPSGAYTGFGADYLQRIASYTGWKYQFVNMDWPTAYRAVQEGRIDFYCVARQTDDRQSSFDFSVYPVCNEEMNLYTLPEKKIYYGDYAAFNGMKIGMLKNSGEIAYFRQYAGEHGFEFRLVEYDMNEAASAALHKGEVDAIALVNYSVERDLKLIGNFGVSPAYMMSKENSRYMKEFSKAQEKLFFDDPNFARNLEKQYYGGEQHYTDVLLTREEAEYIAAAKPLNVAVAQGMAPIEYYDKDSGTYRGVTVDLFKKITALTGLKFNFVPRKDVSQLTGQLAKDEVQLVGSQAQSLNVAKALHVKQSRDFAESAMSVVVRADAKLSKASVVAVPLGYPKFKTIAQQNGYTEIKEYPSFEACVEAVYDRQADLAYVINMCEGYLLDHAHYNNLRALVANDSNYGICVGVSEKSDARLISIINKAIATISVREINEIIVSNTAVVKPEQSVGDYAAKYGYYFLGFGLLVVVLMSYGLMRVQKNKQRQLLLEQLQQHHDYLQHLYNTLPCGMFLYSYEAPHLILSYNVASAKIYGYDKEMPVIGATPAAVVQEGTLAAFNEKFAQCEAAGGQIMYTWPITRQDGSLGYAQCVMDMVETEQGKVFQEIFIDVSEHIRREKEIEKRYVRELNRTGLRDESLLFTVCINITRQTLEQTDLKLDGISIGMPSEEFLGIAMCGIEKLQSEQWRQEFFRYFSCEKAEKAYENGHFEESFKFCRRHKGILQWLRADLTLRHHPKGDLFCFAYFWDISDTEVAEKIMRRLALASCDGFMCIDLVTNHCFQYERSADGSLLYLQTVYGQNDFLTHMLPQMEKAQKEAFFKATNLAELKAKLCGTQRYQVYMTLQGADGKRVDKAITYFYMDEANDIAAATVTDVTEARADAARRAQILADALTAAQKADVAKSQFLSRVSHEMRTPLNAIIGFIELARDADPEKVSNYLASSDIAAKQLLNVINDVLDMSSIESGKMKIALTSFNLRHMISSVTNIYGTQCKQKGVGFETKIITTMDEWLVGDELRVNQILMNLLGNAVKFTESGHIHLTISESSATEDKVFVRFAIADTGCGMNEEMLVRLFKPFEQESAATARKFGGNGLGLSIVKNLVGLMNGSITVESKQGVGSVFKVELPFGRSDVGEKMTLPQTIETLRILVVDDEESEREYMSLVLKRMGVRFSCVDSGAAALKAIGASQREHDLYNVCLIDWRMPEMNGLTTTKKIREQYGKDVVVIVVSAYDFQLAGDQAKQAGANLFLSKPVFQSSLFDLFMTLTGGKVAKPKQEPQEWDFAGKRVLLVEDNTLNQIVAKGYLAKYNVVVELAEDGKKAVEMFERSSAGYYDAILMDIQMPVMNGFEAAEKIRASKHPEAQSIQIIAQTADAFNEDIAKAFSCGMNAHVAKPIMPDVLAKALHKAFLAGKQS